MRKNYLGLIILLFFMACSSSEEELPKTDTTSTFDKTYYLSLRDKLETDLYTIGDKIREEGTFFSDTKAVRLIMEEVYEPNSLNLNAFNKATGLESASRVKMEISLKDPAKVHCVTPSLYAKIQEINELLDNSNSLAEYVEVLENLFNGLSECELSPEEKNIIANLIVSQQVSADFIKNNPELFLMKEASLVKSGTTDYDYWGKCLTAAAGTATVTNVDINYTESGNIIGTFTSQAIDCNAGFVHLNTGSGSGDMLTHQLYVDDSVQPIEPICATCGRINVEVCQEIEDLQKYQ